MPMVLDDFFVEQDDVMNELFGGDDEQPQIPSVEHKLIDYTWHKGLDQSSTGACSQYVRMQFPSPHQNAHNARGG
jgi:hypothetical protein